MSANLIHWNHYQGQSPYRQSWINVRRGVETVWLNVRGVRFLAPLAQLELHPRSEMAQIARFIRNQQRPVQVHQVKYQEAFDGQNPPVPGEDGTPEIYLNRNPTCFMAVLDYLETGHLHYPANICAELFRREMAFWRIPENQIQQCCIINYTRSLDEAQTVAHFRKYLHAVVGGVGKISSGGWVRDCRYKVWMTMMVPTYSKAAMVYNLLMSLLIMVSIILILIQSHRLASGNSDGQAAYDKYAQHILQNNMKNNITIDMPLEDYLCKSLYFIFDLREHYLILTYFDAAFTVFFGLEIVIRCIMAPSLRAILTSVSNYIEIIALFPYSYILYALSTWSHEGHCIQVDIRTYQILSVLRMLRLFRLFYAMSHYDTYRAFIYTIKSSLREFAVLFSLVATVTVISGSVASLIEVAVSDGGNPSFDNLQEALWWAVITLTTVGYGDIIPQHWATRFLTIWVALMGITVIALSTPIVAANFNVIYAYTTGRRLMKRDDEKPIDDIIADDQITTVTNL